MNAHALARLSALIQRGDHVALAPNYSQPTCSDELHG